MDQPKYRQIAADIRQQIATGELQPGQAVMAESELVRRYRVARPTVNRAIAELENQGLLTGHRPRRVAVRQPLTVHLSRSEDLTWPGESATAGADAWVGDAQRAGHGISQPIEVVTQVAGQPAARWLEVGENDIVISRRLTRYTDSQPHNMITFWFPLDIAQGTLLAAPGSIREGSVAWLEKTHGPLAHTAVIGARMPAPDEMIALQIRRGEPLITVWRAARSHDRPVMCSLTVFPADRTELVPDL
jgi:GntR family transcriptional regulator